MPRFAITPRRGLIASAVYTAAWQVCSWSLWALGFSISTTVDFLGWIGLYFIGLAWTVWGLERLSQQIERRRLAAEPNRNDDRVDDLLAAVNGEGVPPNRRVWNPADPAAWYYGRNAQRLKQSLLNLGLYTFAFLLVYWIAGLFHFVSAVEPYELPEGGGQEMMRQTVQVRKVVRKKFVVNPFSSFRFSPPPIDQIDVKLLDESRNEYVVGQGSEGGDGEVGDGSGKGAGFGAGTGKGKIRLIRIKHGDRFWDKNFGIGGDKNMLAEYRTRTRQKVADDPESIEISQLPAFPPKQSPPLIYVVGATTFSPSSSEQKILRDYLTERHGMILGDNIGGRGFHQHFVAAMNAITGTTPVPIPRDDRIHQSPYRLPDLPIVVAHGGTVPLGWKLDGRWVVYYHPGALSDAWRDDHAGIRREIYEMCYQLGVNILFYAHREYNQWLQSQKP